MAEEFSEDDIPDELKEFLRNLAEETGADHGAIVLGPESVPPEIKKLVDEMINRTAPAMALTGDYEDRATSRFMPTQEQLNLAPGDKCLVAEGVETRISMEGLSLAEVIEPTEHAEEFPDYGERLLNSYLLCKFWSTNSHNEPYIGWISRLALTKLPETWMWEEMWPHMVDGNMPEDPPNWLAEVCVRNIQGISEANGDFMPNPASCIKCGSEAVYLTTIELQQCKYFVGHRDGNPNNYFTYAGYGKAESRKSTVTCTVCDYVDDTFERGIDIFVHGDH